MSIDSIVPRQISPRSFSRLCPRTMDLDRRRSSHTTCERISSKISSATRKRSLGKRSCCCCWPRSLTRLIDQAALALLFSTLSTLLSSLRRSASLLSSSDCHDESRWSTRFVDRISNGTVRYPRKSNHGYHSVRGTPTRNPSSPRLTGARGPTCRAALSSREEIRVRVVIPQIEC